MTPKFIIVIAALATLSFMSAEVAYAKDHQLRYTASELSTISGAENVYSRITDAAIAFCGEAYGGFRLVTHRLERDRCIEDVIEDAITEINHPQLSDVHTRALESA